MKIGIRQAVLMDALNKGAKAALSEDAQGDTSNLALLIKAIKIWGHGSIMGKEKKGCY